MAEQRFRFAVVMEKRPLASRWVDEVWQPVGVVLDASDPRERPLPLERAERERWLWTGFDAEVHRSESEGYYLNVSAPEPRVFVAWEVVDNVGTPTLVTLSYNEAARWMDGGAQVDGVPMPAEILAALVTWVAANYHPEPRKKVRRNDPFREGAFRRDSQ
jgi:hypothetical protein